MNGYAHHERARREHKTRHHHTDPCRESRERSHTLYPLNNNKRWKQWRVRTHLNLRISWAMTCSLLKFQKKKKLWESKKNWEKIKKTKKNPLLLLLYLEATYSPDFKHIRKKNTVSDDYVHLNFSPLSMEDVELAKASSVSGLSISLLSSPLIHQKFKICYSEALFFTLSIICFLPSFRTFSRSRRPKLISSGVSNEPSFFVVEGVILASEEDLILNIFRYIYIHMVYFLASKKYLYFSKSVVHNACTGAAAAVVEEQQQQ